MTNNLTGYLSNFTNRLPYHSLITSLSFLILQMSTNFGYYSNDYLYDELYDSVPDIPRRSLQFFFPIDSKPQKYRYLELLYSALFCGVFLILFIFLYLASESSEPRDFYCDPDYLLFQNSSICYKVNEHWLLSVSMFLGLSWNCKFLRIK